MIGIFSSSTGGAGAGEFPVVIGALRKPSSSGTLYSVVGDVSLNMFMSEKCDSIEFESENLAMADEFFVCQCQSRRGNTGTGLGVQH